MYGMRPSAAQAPRRALPCLRASPRSVRIRDARPGCRCARRAARARAARRRRSRDRLRVRCPAPARRRPGDRSDPARAPAASARGPPADCRVGSPRVPAASESRRYRARETRHARAAGRPGRGPAAARAAIRGLPILPAPAGPAQPRDRAFRARALPARSASPTRRRRTPSPLRGRPPATAPTLDATSRPWRAPREAISGSKIDWASRRNPRGA